MLMEQVPGLVPLLLKAHGASNKQLALYLTTLSGVFTIWINPVVSAWSDRHRGPFGRRRPFLLAATGPCAVLLACIPFAPDALRFMLQWHWAATLFRPGSVEWAGAAHRRLLSMLRRL